MTTHQPKFGSEIFSAGKTIFRQGDPPDRFYILTSGTVEVVRQTADGVERAINRLGPGDFFGEIGMLQWQRRLATVRTVTDVQLLSMDRETFRSWLSGSKLAATEIGKTGAQRMAQDVLPDEAMPAAEVVTPSESEPAPLSETAVAELLPAPITASSDSGPADFAMGQVIVSQGETADKFYIIVNGRVEVVTDRPDGSEHFIANLESGDYFGEIGLLIGGMRVATVRALSDIQTVSFDREAFVQWLSKSPESKSEVVSTAHERLSDIVNKRKQ